MNKLISYFNKKSNSSQTTQTIKSAKFTLFKRNKPSNGNSNAISLVNELKLNQNDYSYVSSSQDSLNITMNNNSSMFTMSPLSDINSLLNKSIIASSQDNTIVSATIEEMYSDNINIVKDSANVQLVGYNQSIKAISPWSIHRANDLDHKIQSKLSELKSTARSLNVTLPAHITMLETVYNLKMNTLTQEYLTNKKRADEKRSINTILQHFLNASKLIRNYSTFHRSKSIEISNSLTKAQLKQQELEQQIKQQINSIQNELLTSICEIELKFQKQLNNQRTCKQRHIYATDMSMMQKRIRSRKRLHKSVLINSASELRDKRKLNNMSLND